MGFKVTQLIGLAYNQANLAPANYQPLEPNQLEVGLLSLNQVLGQVMIDPSLVPYWKKYEDHFDVNEETYFIENLINIQTFTFILDTYVRYPIFPDNFRDYYGTAKSLNVEAQPAIYTLTRTLGGANVAVTPNPKQAYDFTIWGTFGLLDAEYNDDLSTIYDQYYITYLTLLTAQRLCLNLSMETPLALSIEIARQDNLIRNASQPLDMTNVYVSNFSGDSYINFMQAAIGDGYTVKRRGVL